MKNYLIAFIIFFGVWTMKAQSIQRDSSQKVMIKKINLSNEIVVDKTIELNSNPTPVNYDGSNNPEDYGYRLIYINGERYYIKEDRNITVLFKPQN